MLFLILFFFLNLTFLCNFKILKIGINKNGEVNNVAL